MGGDLVALSTSANNYAITLTLYRDTLGIPLDLTEDIAIYHWDNSTSMYMLDSTMYVPLDAAASTALLPSFPYGVEVGVYNATLTLPAGQYRIVNNTCCRNGAILNASAPLSESMIIHTDLTVDAAGTNSTPGCLAMPVAYFALNSPATYNPLPYDPNADSIAWELTDPIGNTAFDPLTGLFTFTPVVGFTAPSADPAGPFTMNSVTGEISWTPNLLGNFDQSFIVKEYNAGVQIGTIIRDMQYVIVEPDTNNNPPGFILMSAVNTNTQQNYNYLEYTPGQPLSFQIEGTDQDNGTLQMEANGEVFHLQNSPATFSTVVFGNQIIGNLSWTPPANFDRDMIVAIRLRDGYFTKDYTLMLKKASTTGVSTIPAALNSISVYPNPAHNELKVAMELNKDINGDISIFNTIGQKVKTMYNGKMMKGTHMVSDDISLAPGTYFVVVRDNGKAVKTVNVTVE